MISPGHAQRRGLLPLVCIAALSTTLIASAPARRLAVSALSVLICAPALLCCCMLLVLYAADFSKRTNTLRIDWTTAAFSKAMLAALLALLGSPLLAPLLRRAPPLEVQLPEVRVPLPVVDATALVDDLRELAANLSSAEARFAFSDDVQLQSASLLPASIPICDAEHGCPLWLPAAIIAAVAVGVYLVQAVLSFTLMGCGGGAGMWRQTQPITEAAEWEELRRLLGVRCDAFASRYGFGMALHDAWRVRNPVLHRHFEAEQLARQEARRPTNVARLFHGTPAPNAYAILADGFRLPLHSGMFGAGIYFADCPLKSLQYTAAGGSRVHSGAKARRGYMLVCDVELGRSLVRDSAKPDLDPKRDLDRGAAGRLLNKPDYDSVSGAARPGGLRVPEYVVYNESQALPRYILAVSQVRRGDPAQLTARAPPRSPASVPAADPAAASSAAAPLADSRRASYIGQHADRVVHAISRLAVEEKWQADAASGPSNSSALTSTPDGTDAATSMPGEAQHFRAQIRGGLWRPSHLFEIDVERAALVERAVVRGWTEPRFERALPVEAITANAHPAADLLHLQVDAEGAQPFALWLKLLPESNETSNSVSNRRTLLLNLLEVIKERRMQLQPQSPPRKCWDDEASFYEQPKSGEGATQPKPRQGWQRVTSALFAVVFCPIVFPAVMVYLFAKFLLLRLLPKCVSATYRLAAECNSAMQSHWGALMRFVALHFKRCLYSISDHVLVPIARVAHALLVRPVVAAANHCGALLLILHRRLLRPAAFRVALCFEGLVDGAWTLTRRLGSGTLRNLVLLDELLTGGAISVAEQARVPLMHFCRALGHVAHLYLWQPCLRLVTTVCRALWRCSCWLHEEVLLPLYTAIRAACGVCSRGAGCCCAWVQRRLWQPLCAILKRMYRGLQHACRKGHRVLLVPTCAAVASLCQSMSQAFRRYVVAPLGSVASVIARTLLNVLGKAYSWGGQLVACVGSGLQQAATFLGSSLQAACRAAQRVVMGVGDAARGLSQAILRTTETRSSRKGDDPAVVWTRL